jgi:hypothetical protein
MLTEVEPTQQVTGEPFRRWYTDGTMDLVVWFSTEHEIVGFQLALPQAGRQMALTWHKGKGVSVAEIDDGEGRPGRPKMSPILIEDQSIDLPNAIAQFRNAAQEVPSSEFILAKLESIKRQMKG